MSFYYDNEEEAKERRIDYDLSSACEYADVDGSGGFYLKDVAYVLAACMGENDGPSYHWLCAMKDHTYAYVKGGCDYTGWDCQAGGSAKIFPTLKEALAEAPEKEEYHDNRRIRDSLRKQLAGELAFGEVEI